MSEGKGWHDDEGAARGQGQVCEVCGSTQIVYSQTSRAYVCDVCGTQSEQVFQEMSDLHDGVPISINRRMDTQASRKQSQLLKELDRAGSLSQESMRQDMASAASWALTGSQLSSQSQHLDVGEPFSLSQGALPFSQDSKRGETLEGPSQSQTHANQGAEARARQSPASLKRRWANLGDKELTMTFLRSFQQVLQVQALAIGKIIDIPKKHYMKVLKQLWGRYLLKWKQEKAPIVMIINGEIYSPGSKLYNTYLESLDDVPKLTPLSRNLTLAFQLVVCRWFRLPVVPEDLIQWCLVGRLPFVNPIPVISKKIAVSTSFSPSFHFWKSRNERNIYRILHPGRVSKLASTLARNIGMPLPASNAPLIACRLCVKMDMEHAVEKVVKVCRLLFCKRPALFKNTSLERLLYKLSNNDCLPFRWQYEDSLNADSFLWIVGQVVMGVAMSTDRLPGKSQHSRRLEGFKLNTDMNSSEAVRQSAIANKQFLKGGTAVQGGGSLYQLPSGKAILNSRYVISVSNEKNDRGVDDSSASSDESVNFVSDREDENALDFTIQKPHDKQFCTIPDKYLEELHENVSALRKQHLTKDRVRARSEDGTVDSSVCDTVTPSSQHISLKERALQYSGSVVWRPLTNWATNSLPRKHTFRLFPDTLSEKLRQLIRIASDFIPETESNIAYTVAAAEHVLLEYGYYVPRESELN